MKFLASASGLFLLFTFLFSSQVSLTSCQKETIRDTVRIKDTIKIRDTVVIRDSVNCNCYDLTNGLVAHYNFNSGSLNDLSGKNNHITFNNATKTTDRFAKANNAYSFDGANSYMKVANSATLNPTQGITLMAIINIKSFYLGNCGGNQVFGKGWNDYIDGYYALRYVSASGCNKPIDPTKEYWNFGYGNLSSKAVIEHNENNVVANKWYNVICTYENGVSKLYVDGVLINTKNGPQTIFTPNSQELFIGKHGDPQSPYYFGGTIDEIRIYNRAVCQGEVNQLNKLVD